MATNEVLTSRTWRKEKNEKRESGFKRGSYLDPLPTHSIITTATARLTAISFHYSWICTSTSSTIEIPELHHFGSRFEGSELPFVASTLRPRSPTFSKVTGDFEHEGGCN
ncbi:hypothetical protein CRG98_014843 [Punica granatum]|uniref:Uncharacterized protein n=1 Tax=Punica granatum TaxID=22663 RepID=A0A2I0K8B8_PUNGR|nr:hypothetical protein CRG98_014843 [Punica granatum]